MDGILRKPEAVGVSSGEYHRSVSLASFMNFIQAQMQPFECKDVDVCDLNDNAPVQEQLIDAVVEDLTFMADVLGIETSILLEDKYLTVYQEAIDATTKLYFNSSFFRMLENVIRIKEIYSLIHLEKQKPNVIKKSSEKLLTWLALLYE